MTRREAKRLGRTHYLRERPCPNGHNGYRRISDYKCVASERERKFRRYLTAPALPWEMIKPFCGRQSTKGGG